MGGWPSQNLATCSCRGKLRQGWSPSSRGEVSRKPSWELEHTVLAFSMVQGEEGRNAAFPFTDGKTKETWHPFSSSLTRMTTPVPVIDCQLQRLFFLLNKLTKCQSLGLEPEAQSGLGSLWAGHKACPSLSLGYHLAVPLLPRSGDVCSPKPWSWAEGGTQGISVQKS